MELRNKFTFIVSVFCICSVFSQSLNIVEGTRLFVSSNEVLYCGDDVSVTDEDSKIIIDSDNTSSGVLKIDGDYLGDDNSLEYRLYISEDKWGLISSPVLGQSFLDFFDVNTNVAQSSKSNKLGLAKYKTDEVKDKRWIYYVTVDNDNDIEQEENFQGDFEESRGYSALIDNSGSEQKLTFRGDDFQSDDISYTLNVGNEHSFNCIGNPYMSYLPFMGSDNGSVLYNNVDSLDEFSKGIYVLNSSGIGYDFKGNDDEYFIKPGEAFFVNAKNDSSEPLKFTFLKELQIFFSDNSDNSSTQKSTSINFEIIVKLSDNLNQELKSTEIKYKENKTAGLDPGCDAQAFGGGSFNINTRLVGLPVEKRDIMEQCLSNSNYEEIVVPLSVKASANTTLAFSTETFNLPKGVDVYLEDKESDILKKINDNSSYSVTFNDDFSSAERFYIHTSSKPLSNNIENYSEPLVKIYKKEEKAITILGLENQNLTQLKIYNILGKEVVCYNLTQENQQTIKLSNFSSGVYIASLISSFGDVIVTKKIIF